MRYTALAFVCNVCRRGGTAAAVWLDFRLDRSEKLVAGSWTGTEPPLVKLVVVVGRLNLEQYKPIRKKHLRRYVCVCVCGR